MKLHQTLESAANFMAQDSNKNDVLLGCIVYPHLHHLVFNNLQKLKLVDCFVMNTHNMILASRYDNAAQIKRVGSHPAPRDLIHQVEGVQQETLIELFNSNSEAARQCAAGTVDGCITTLVAAQQYRLHVLADFGPVPMGFSIHAKIQQPI
ncbi:MULTISPECIES: prephenate dehydratase domain-containing protein [Serratia]|uniref:prephenate dehydratase domain-containing protein n=1 Tax=Serratia TaxID=613 RepID=UPI001650A742|nr:MULTISPECIES: prephenate dehydratase domain-containing protein [Serratia]